MSGLSMSLGLKQNNVISSTLDITNSLTAGQPTTIEISIFPSVSLANKPISGSGIVISTATIPVISVNYNTTTLEIDGTGKLNVKAGGYTITSTQLAALMNTTDHFTLNATT